MKQSFHFLGIVTAVHGGAPVVCGKYQRNWEAEEFCQVAAAYKDLTTQQYVVVECHEDWHDVIFADNSVLMEDGTLKDKNEKPSKAIARHAAGLANG